MATTPHVQKSARIVARPYNSPLIACQHTHMHTQREGGREREKEREREGEREKANAHMHTIQVSLLALSLSLSFIYTRRALSVSFFLSWTGVPLCLFI